MQSFQKDACGSDGLGAENSVSFYGHGGPKDWRTGVDGNEEKRVVTLTLGVF